VITIAIGGGESTHILLNMALDLWGTAILLIKLIAYYQLRPSLPVVFVIYLNDTQNARNLNFWRFELSTSLLFLNNAYCPFC